MNSVFMQDFASRDPRSVRRSLTTDASEPQNGSAEKATTPQQFLRHSETIGALGEITSGVRNGLHRAGLILIGLLLGAGLLQLVCHR